MKVVHINKPLPIYARAKRRTRKKTSCLSFSSPVLPLHCSFVRRSTDRHRVLRLHPSNIHPPTPNHEPSIGHSSPGPCTQNKNLRCKVSRSGSPKRENKLNNHSSRRCAAFAGRHWSTFGPGTRGLGRPGAFPVSVCCCYFYFFCLCAVGRSCWVVMYGYSDLGATA